MLESSAALRAAADSGLYSVSLFSVVTPLFFIDGCFVCYIKLLNSVALKCDH